MSEDSVGTTPRGAGAMHDGTHDEDHWETHCSRCGDEYPREREDLICEACEKHIQMEKLRAGVPCGRCDGSGFIHGTYCDIQRAINGRDERCPNCHGDGRVAWEPELDDVHPDLRTEVKVRAE